MTDLDAALRALRSGHLVVLPTDTVYGVGALASDRRALERVFEVKGRPPDRPLPVLGASIEALSAAAAFDERARALAHAFWPGPLTLVLLRAPGFDADLGRGGEESVAVRVPRHPVALELLEAAGPLAVTSANRSGSPPATTVDEARAALGEGVRVYLDGGTCPGGEASTVLELISEPEVLRPGPIPEDELLQMLTS